MHAADNAVASDPAPEAGSTFCKAHAEIGAVLGSRFLKMEQVRVLVMHPVHAM